MNNSFYKQTYPQNEAINWNPNLTNTALNLLNLVPVSKDSTSASTNGLDQFYMSELLQIISSKDGETTARIVSGIIYSLIQLSQQQQQHQQQPKHPFSNDRRILLLRGFLRILSDDNSVSLTIVAFSSAPCVTAGLLEDVERCGRLPPCVCLLVGLSLFMYFKRAAAGAVMPAQKAAQEAAALEALKYFRAKLDAIAGAKKTVAFPAGAAFTRLLRNFLETQGPALQLQQVVHLFVEVPQQQFHAGKRVLYTPPADLTHPAALLYALGPAANPHSMIFKARKTLNEEDVAKIIEVLVRIIPYNKSGRVWDIEGIATEIQALQKREGLDRNKVLGTLDRPTLFVADSHGVTLISDLYKRFNGGQSLPSAFLLGAWANKTAQLSLLRAAIIAQDPSLYLSTPTIPTPTTIPTSSSPQPQRPHSLWAQKALMSALLRISEDPECSSPVQFLLEVPVRSVPDDLFSAIAGCKEGPPLRLALEKALLAPRSAINNNNNNNNGINGINSNNNGINNSSIVQRHPLKVVLAVLCDMYSMDRGALPAILAAVSCGDDARTRVFPALLEAAPPAFAVDLAVHAYAARLLDLDRWLAAKARAPAILAACTAHVLERAAARDVETPYAAILRGIRAAGGPGPAECARLAADPAVVEALRAQRDKAREICAKETFAAVYSGKTSVSAFVDTLVAAARKSASQDKDKDKERDKSGDDDEVIAQYRYTVKCILDECTYIDGYPAQNLRISADILGELIAREAVRDADLVRAMQNVLDSLRAGQAKRFRYGTMALAHFVPALRRFPVYTAKLLGTPGLEDAAPALYAQIAAIAGTGKSAAEAGKAGTYDDSAIPAKVRGVLNNISMQNVEKMAVDFRRGVSLSLSSSGGGGGVSANGAPDPKVMNAVAQNILRRIIGEESHHMIYALFLDRVGLPSLRRAIMAAVYAEIRRNLSIWGVVDNTTNNSNEIKDVNKEVNITPAGILPITATEKELERSRKQLGTLGKWVGLETLGRDEPIRRADLDLRALLVRTQHAPALECALPFVSNVLVCCKTSTVFRPPNRWLCSVLRALADIRAAPGHREKTKHEIDRVFEALGINEDAAASYASTTITSSSGSPQHQFYHGDESATEATLDFIRGILYSRVRVDSTLDALNTAIVAASTSSPASKKLGGAGGGAVEIVKKPILMRKTVAAVARVVEMVCRGEVPRAAADAVQAAESVVLNDLAHDPSEERLVTSAVLMAKHLAGGMALVTCNHTLAKLMIERLVAVLADLCPKGGSGAGNGCDVPEAELADVAKLLVYENFDAACIAVARRAEEVAAASMLERIADERCERREYCRCRPPTPFTSASWLRKTEGPLALLPKTKKYLDEANNSENRSSGLSQEEYEVYRDFGHLPILIPKMPLKPIFGGNRVPAGLSSPASLSSASSSSSGQATGAELRAAAVEQVNALVTASQQISRGLDMLSYEEVCTQYLLSLKRIETVCAQRAGGLPADARAAQVLAGLKKGDPVLAAAEDLEYALDYALRLQSGQEAGAIADRSTLLWPLVRYLIDASTPEMTREALLLALRRRPKVFKPFVSNCFLKLPQEKKFFPPLIPALLGAQLIDQGFVDNAIYNAMHDAPNDQIAAQAVSILQNFVLTQKYPPTDFERSINALASRPSLPYPARRIVEDAQRLLAQQRLKNQNHAAQVQQRQQFRQSPQQPQHPQQQQQYHGHQALSLSQQQQQIHYPSQSPQLVQSQSLQSQSQSTQMVQPKSQPQSPIKPNQVQETQNDGNNNEIDVELDTAFYDWCDAVESKDEGRMREAFLRVERDLEGSEVPLLKRGLEIALRDAQLTSPDAPWRYLRVDAYGSLVVYLSQSTARPGAGRKWFGYALEQLLGRLKAHRAGEGGLEALTHLVCFLAGHADVFPVNTGLPEEQSVPVEPLAVFSNFLSYIHPFYEPGLAFVWLEAISNKVFLRRALAAQQNWGLVQRHLVMLMRFLYTLRAKIGEDDTTSSDDVISENDYDVNDGEPNTENSNNNVHSNQRPMHLFIEGAAQLLATIREAYPRFLAAYHFSLCNAIPDSLANLRNIILSAAPAAVPPLFTHVHVEQLPGAGEGPELLDDYASILKECVAPQDVEACIAAPDTASYAWVGAAFLPSVRNATLQSACFSALVLFVGDATVRAPALRNNAFRFLQRLLALLQPQHAYHLLGAIANQLRYPNAHTVFFGNVMTSLIRSPVPSSSTSTSVISGESVKELILRVLCERIRRTQVQPWGLIVTWAEVLLNPKYKLFECRALAENPSVNNMLHLQREKLIELYKSSSQGGSGKQC